MNTLAIAATCPAHCYHKLILVTNEPSMWATTRQSQQNEWAPSEDTDHPGHPPSLIRIFAVRMKKAWVLSYPLSAPQRLIWLGGCPGWSESSLGAQSFCWFCYVVAQCLLLLYLFSGIWLHRCGNGKKEWKMFRVRRFHKMVKLSYI